MKKLIFFASSDFALPALKKLRSKGRQLSVVSAPPRPSGRGMRATPTPIAEFAAGVGLEIATPADPGQGDFLEWLNKQNGEISVVIAYGRKLPPAVLAVAPAINFHGSLLPRWQGASPINQAILHGDKTTGVTAILMNEQIDKGAIINSAQIGIKSAENFVSLYHRLAELTARMIIDTLEGFLSGRYKPIPQPAQGVTRAPRITSADRKLDWRLGCRQLERRVRAFAPSAWGEVAGIRYRIAEAGAVENFKGKAGEWEIASGIVGCGSGGLRILRLCPPNKREMSFAEFRRGFRP